ncbi:hypothetical protein QVD17_37818 [Tagetes erecta]|uniref:Uncharacterized protein n=1 Tax=Tagetes erecta TaxID=13708 RepID=A0AAD8NK57_TARER|nr:hypothetical protein QVD17_37818 [Tagetes erecta]
MVVVTGVTGKSPELVVVTGVGGGEGVLQVLQSVCVRGCSSLSPSSCSPASFLLQFKPKSKPNHNHIHNQEHDQITTLCLKIVAVDTVNRGLD